MFAFQPNDTVFWNINGITSICLCLYCSYNYFSQIRTIFVLVHLREKLFLVKKIFPSDRCFDKKQESCIQGEMICTFGTKIVAIR